MDVRLNSRPVRRSSPERHDRVVEQRDDHARAEPEVEPQADVHDDERHRVQHRLDALVAQLATHGGADVLDAADVRLRLGEAGREVALDLLADSLRDDREGLGAGGEPLLGAHLADADASALDRGLEVLLARRLLELEVDLVADLGVEAPALDREPRLDGVDDALHVLVAHEGDALDADEERVLLIRAVGLDRRP